ncbi:prepilin-type N-terminal cleavage/methylation domain-containing protein [Paraglaciecola aquimarina]|uniref:Prepilin-type N-terminal cleavage/methylation domain-containing protein n=1 Tax=Paraglaciecola algarum TaxID=3050085 RepID=A0ABS9D9L1_9ALTE|nr:prepilin-type N-terminal cleavage/methylation domain-containing protein [Paraglaciecola sp. G1-23]MCF2948341.1 prepilin-type N-terminal cleavage/methylation domain-containing protein [Paraglaciecola sp. G1-23]
MNISKGFSLVEVLVASLIIMLGVTGYVTLQAEYVVADRNINLRNLALQLAVDKLNDLSFYQLLISLNSVPAYNQIISDGGGRISAGTKKIQLSNNADSHDFELHWQITDLFYIDSNFDQSADLWVTQGHPLFPKLAPSVSDLKKVDIKVEWLDLNAETQVINVNSYIAPLPAHNSYQTFFRENSVNAKP